MQSHLIKMTIFQNCYQSQILSEITYPDKEINHKNLSLANETKTQLLCPKTEHPKLFLTSQHTEPYHSTSINTPIHNPNQTDPFDPELSRWKLEKHNPWPLIAAETLYPNQYITHIKITKDSHILSIRYLLIPRWPSTNWDARSLTVRWDWQSYACRILNTYLTKNHTPCMKPNE